jgi:hypothetical protein
LFFFKNKFLKKKQKKKRIIINFNIKKKYKSFFVVLYMQTFKQLKYYKNINNLNYLQFCSILKKKNIFFLDNNYMLKKILLILNFFFYKSTSYKNKMPYTLSLKFNRLQATNYYLYKNFRIHYKSLLSPFIFELGLFFFYKKFLNDLDIFNYIFLKKKSKKFILKTLYYFIGL